MVEVVGRLPVVEDLIAVLDRREDGGNGVRYEEDVEGKDGVDSRCFRFWWTGGPEDG
jgi:hypothetical protein